MIKSWFQHRERGSPILVKLILWIALNIGRFPARLLLYPISVYFFLTAITQRRASHYYLQLILPYRPSALDILRHIHCFAATILDRVYLLAGKHKNYHIQLYNEQLLLELTKTGQGCLLIGAHIGSFEVLRTLAIENSKFSLKILMNPEHNATVTGLLTQLNSKLSDTIIPIGQLDTVINIHTAISQGTMIGLLGDRAIYGEKTVTCQLLGKNAQFPTGPALLASSLKVPVLLFLGIYQSNKRYAIYFERLPDANFGPRNQRDNKLQQWLQHYVTRLEYYLHLYPYNWFNFYEFWDEN